MKVEQVEVVMRALFKEQEAVRASKAKRKVIRAGRRGGKTVLASEVAIEALLAGKRPLYATPTADQLDKFWYEVKWSLGGAIEAGVYKKDETKHSIERVGSENRLRAKTAWNADTLRGDYADPLILDELQLMCEDTLEVVGFPMLLDNDGDAVLIYTPPSMRSLGVSKARDPRWAAKLYKQAVADTTGRWEGFTWTSHDNPHISEVALAEIIRDMSKASYRKEIMAEDEEELLNQLVYGMFDERFIIEPFVLDKGWSRYVFHDFGSANPAGLFAAVDPATGYIYIYDEYLPGAGRTMGQHVEEWVRRTEGLRVIKRIGGNVTTEEEIRQGYAAHGWPIYAPRWKEPRVQMEHVWGLMERKMLYIFKNVINYREELMNCLWETDAEGKTLDKIRNESRYHLISAARYGLSEFKMETNENDAFAVVKNYRPSSMGGHLIGRNRS